MTTVTTSWDDGDTLDTRLATLLDRYSVKGTFYLSKEYRPVRLVDAEIKEIALQHEIGAHTLTHPDLRTLSRAQKEHEILGSKQWLETLLERPIQMFCYPSGRYDNETKEVVRAAGFIAARTVRQGVIASPLDLFELDTTIHLYPLPFRKRDAHRYQWRYLLQPLIQRYPVLRSVGVSLFAMRSWESAARAAYLSAEREGGVFHLWGHSWEIEKYGLWDELESFLRFLQERAHLGKCRFVTNSEAIQNI